MRHRRYQQTIDQFRGAILLGTPITPGGIAYWITAHAKWRGMSDIVPDWTKIQNGPVDDYYQKNIMAIWNIQLKFEEIWGQENMLIRRRQVDSVQLEVIFCYAQEQVRRRGANKAQFVSIVLRFLGMRTTRKGCEPMLLWNWLIKICLVCSP